MMFDPGAAATTLTAATDVSAWSVSSITSDLAAELFQASLLPYLAFLWLLSRPETKTPKGGTFGFAFLLVFVVATIPAGILGKKPILLKEQHYVCINCCMYQKRENGRSLYSARCCGRGEEVRVVRLLCRALDWNRRRERKAEGGNPTADFVRPPRATCEEEMKTTDVCVDKWRPCLPSS